MSTATLTIDLDAITANWLALDALSASAIETGAVVKANGYGLGAARVARTLQKAGVRRFFVAISEEGAALREALGPDPEINILGGHMSGDTDMIHDMGLTPIINSVEQLTRHLESLPDHAFGIQLDTGMNRLGMEPAEWMAVIDIVMHARPNMIISHLACADEPENPMNRFQLDQFHKLTDGLDVPRSLAATGGILLGPDFHFDITRAGIGLYGAAPFTNAKSTAQVDIPVIQVRAVEAGETVGYGNTWKATAPARVATLSGGYADGILRALSNGATLHYSGVACPLIGRVSMDLLTIDVTHLSEDPKELQLVGPNQTVDQLAEAAGTIGYEILTSFGPRYGRRYRGGV